MIEIREHLRSHSDATRPLSVGLVPTTRDVGRLVLH